MLKTRESSQTGWGRYQQEPQAQRDPLESAGGKGVTRITKHSFLQVTVKVTARCQGSWRQKQTQFSENGQGEGS